MATKRFDSDHTIGIEMYHRILYQIINQHKKLRPEFRSITQPKVAGISYVTQIRIGPRD